MKRALLALGLVMIGTVASAVSEVVGLLELFNYYEYSPALLSSGQPTRAQFPAVRAAGVEAIINLAPVTDPGALPDEQAVVTTLGMAYQHIPVDWDHPPRAARWKRSGRIIPAMSCPRSRNGSSSSPTVWQAAALECAARPIHDEIGA